MKRLLIIAQKVDPHDDLLGFFADWIEEFKKQNIDVTVIALKKKSGESKFVRWVRLAWRIFREVPKNDAVFAHMSPMFAMIAGPWAWLWRKPVYLWYLHRSLTLKLKIAEKFSSKIFTASAASLTIKSKKIVEVGHGINLSRFATTRQTWGNRILAVGRISPIKNYETLLETGFPVTIVGRPVMPDDFPYFEKLKQMNNAHFVGFVPYSRIPEQYAHADLVVNLSPTGGIDKAILEAMASGCLVLVCNRAFNLPEELMFESGNALDLKKKIEQLNALPVDQKKMLSKMLVDLVAQQHNLPVTIENIIHHMMLS